MAKFTYESSTDFDVPDTVHFTNTSYVPEGITQAVSYLWDFGDTTTSTDNSPMHIYRYPGKYTVTLTPVTDAPNRLLAAQADLKFIRTIKGDTLLFEDFEGLAVIPADWALFNLDQGTVASSRADLQGLNDSAWICWNSTYFGSRVAIATSWYQEQSTTGLDANDWLILPAITLGQNTTLKWDAMSLTSSGDYPDSYRIWVSTTTQDPTGCQANPFLYRVIDEEAGDDVGGEGIQTRQVSLKNYAGQTVYIAFQLNTPDPGGDRLALDNILVIDE